MEKSVLSDEPFQRTNFLPLPTTFGALLTTFGAGQKIADTTVSGQEIIRCPLTLTLSPYEVVE